MYTRRAIDAQTEFLVAVAHESPWSISHSVVCYVCTYTLTYKCTRETRPPIHGHIFFNSLSGGEDGRLYNYVSISLVSVSWDASLFVTSEPLISVKTKNLVA